MTQYHTLIWYNTKLAWNEIKTKTHTRDEQHSTERLLSTVYWQWTTSYICNKCSQVFKKQATLLPFTLQACCSMFSAMSWDKHCASSGQEALQSTTSNTSAETQTNSNNNANHKFNNTADCTRQTPTLHGIVHVISLYHRNCRRLASWAANSSVTWRQWINQSINQSIYNAP